MAVTTSPQRCGSGIFSVGSQVRGLCPVAKAHLKIAYVTMHRTVAFARTAGIMSNIPKAAHN